MTSEDTFVYVKYGYICTDCMDFSGTVLCKLVSTLPVLVHVSLNCNLSLVLCIVHGTWYLVPGTLLCPVADSCMDHATRYRLVES